VGSLYAVRVRNKITVRAQERVPRRAFIRAHNTGVTRTAGRVGRAQTTGPARALGDAQNKTPALPGFSGGAQKKTSALPGLAGGAQKKNAALPGLAGGAQKKTPALPGPSKNGLSGVRTNDST
jgi:hypothetical protein